MSVLRTVDIAKMCVDEYIENHPGQSFKINNEACDIFIEACSIIDYLYEEVDASSIEISVPDRSHIVLSMNTPDFTVQKNNREFIRMMEIVSFIEIKNVDGSSITINFVMPGIWK